LNEKELIKKLPKIDLHCHIDGSVRPETILDIALQEKISVPTEDLEGFKKYVQVSPSCTSLKEYLEKFDFTLKVMQKAEYIRRIVFELIEDCYNRNVKYTELRFAPLLFMQGNLSFDEVLESILEGVKAGEEKYKVVANLILICMRHHSPETNIKMVEKGKKYIGRGVVAVDLAGNEADFPPELHKEAFKLAKDYGFHRTVHAGEVNAPQNIITAVKELYAERIGHGVYAIKDKKVFEYVKQNKIPLEICVTSNVQTQAVEGLESHPIKKYFDEGIKITVNTDNTTVSNTTLDDEYEVLLNEFGFTIEDIKKVILNGIDVCFASEKQKEELIKIFNDDFKNN
jgi:adenosine deaminase